MVSIEVAVCTLVGIVSTMSTYVDVDPSIDKEMTQLWIG